MQAPADSPPQASSRSVATFITEALSSGAAQDAALISWAFSDARPWSCECRLYSRGRGHREACLPALSFHSRFPFSTVPASAARLPTDFRTVVVADLRFVGDQSGGAAHRPRFGVRLHPSSITGTTVTTASRALGATGAAARHLGWPPLDGETTRAQQFARRARDQTALNQESSSFRAPSAVTTGTYNNNTHTACAHAAVAFVHRTRTKP
jgi:hypothetical protein